MQTLLKNLFNSINYRDYIYPSIDKNILMPLVKGILRYRKINFLTTSALFICISRVKPLTKDPEQVGMTKISLYKGMSV
jgi:hypothetical protein